MKPLIYVLFAVCLVGCREQGKDRQQATPQTAKKATAEQLYAASEAKFTHSIQTVSKAAEKYPMPTQASKATAEQLLAESWNIATEFYGKEHTTEVRAIEYADYLKLFCREAKYTKFDAKKEVCVAAFEFASMHVKDSPEHECFYTYMQEQAVVSMSEFDPDLAMDYLGDPRFGPGYHCTEEELARYHNEQ